MNGSCPITSNPSPSSLQHTLVPFYVLKTVGNTCMIYGEVIITKKQDFLTSNNVAINFETKLFRATVLPNTTVYRNFRSLSWTYLYLSTIFSVRPTFASPFLPFLGDVLVVNFFTGTSVVQLCKTRRVTPRKNGSWNIEHSGINRILCHMPYPSY